MFNYLFIPSEEAEIEGAANKAHEFLRLMRIVRNNPASTSLIFLMDARGEIKGYEQYLVGIYTYQGPVAHFRTEDIKTLKSVWQNYKENVIASSIKNRIWYAIFLHEMANQSYYDEFKILHDIMALECLFSTVPQEVAFQVSSRIAWFLFPKSLPGGGVARRGIFRHLKTIYGIRSKIVHGVLIEEELTKMVFFKWLCQ